MTKSRTSNSSVCRVHKNANYTVMSNYHLQSRNLSLKAIGLLSKVFSLPDDWDYSIAGLTHICKENETAIKSALNELKEWGYLTVTKLMPSETKSGRIEYVYDFYEYSKKDTASGKSSSTPKVHKEKQDIENLPLETTEITPIKQEVEKLNDNLNRDIQYKMTLIGPNRDDFYFLLGDKNLSLYGSQGQIRSAVLALKLSEVKLFNNITGDTPILLLDDMFSELDINKRNNILKYLDRNIQTIITTTDIKNINEKIKEKTNVYEIKEGKIISREIISKQEGD